MIELKGKPVADDILKVSTNLIKEKISQYYRQPKLLVITIGEDEASKVYVNKKQKACEKCRIIFEHIKYPIDIPDRTLLRDLQHFNNDKNIDGILIQQPFPKNLKGVEQYIRQDKDVDGFTMMNLGYTLYNNCVDGIYACTPIGIKEILSYYNIDLKGKHVVIIGRSNIVGKPLIGMMLDSDATVTICHSKTNDLKSICRTADILIVAIGKPKFIDSSYLGHNTKVVVDVGINRDEDGKICGDCDQKDIQKFWNYLNINDTYITPVPGGVGPMTVAMLISNITNTYLEHLKEI